MAESNPLVMLESDLEDWVCQHIQEVVGPRAEVVGRQIRVPGGGILDVLAIEREPYPGDEFTLTVIEIKRHTIDESAVAQLLSYLGALLNIKALGLGGGTGVKELRGVLAGPGIAKRAAFAVNALRNVDFVNLSWTISADRWPGIAIHSVRDEDRASLRTLLGSFVHRRPGRALAQSAVAEARAYGWHLTVVGWAVVFVEPRAESPRSHIRRSTLKAWLSYAKDSLALYLKCTHPACTTMDLLPPPKDHA